MTKKLFFQAVIKYLCGVLLVGALVFLPAGGFDYPGGWLLMGVLFLPILLAGIVMMFKNPDLLRRRLDGRETEKSQRGVVLGSGLMFVFGFVAAGLDYRFGWLPLPGWVSPAAAAVMLMAYGIFAEVLRENTYLSRTVGVEAGQKLIDTGLYGIVRHPMYMATVFLFLSIPLVLGSLISFAVFLLYPILIAVRIRGEEAVLERELEGYAAYKKRVKYRVLPLIW